MSDRIYLKISKFGFYRTSRIKCPIKMEYICDKARHLVCLPYSIANLHKMAKELGINKCWFHKNHYDIPKLRINEITKKCKVVTSKEIVLIIKGEIL